MATHIDTNTWKMDWKTSYLKLIQILLQDIENTTHEDKYVNH